jgi:hypothetical protein
MHRGVKRESGWAAALSSFVTLTIEVDPALGIGQVEGIGDGVKVFQDPNTITIISHESGIFNDRRDTGRYHIHTISAIHQALHAIQRDSPLRGKIDPVSAVPAK